MKPYKPTYFLSQAVHSSEKVNVPSPSTKTSEADRGGLNKIQTELNNSERSYIQDQKDLIASSADPIYECPPDPQYLTIDSVDIIP